MRRRWEGSERRRGARLESRCETFDRLGSQNANSGGIEEAGEKRKIPFYLLLYFVNPRRKERRVKSCPRRGRKWASTAGNFSCRSLIISLPVFQFFFLRHGGLYCGILVSFDWKKYPEFLFGIISIVVFIDWRV